MSELIAVDGTKTTVEPKGDKWSLEEMQTIVGGWIEIVALPAADQPDRMIVVNEEGKLNGLPINDIATDLFRAVYSQTSDYIAGPALICTQTQEGELI